MIIIKHRINTVSELQSVSHSYGVEIDIRSHGSELILHHDPFVQGESFINWLQFYKHGTLILNVKEEGLEPRLITLMEQHGIKDYFFLDQSFPFLMKYFQAGEGRSAVRVSEFESVETALSLAGKVCWIWVDCFTRFPLSFEHARQLQEAKFKLCLVSPELQGRNAETEIPKMKQLLKDIGIQAEAVCTKRPDLWEK